MNTRKEEYARLQEVKRLLAAGRKVPRSKCGDCQQCLKARLALARWTK